MDQLEDLLRRMAAAEAAIEELRNGKTKKRIKDPVGTSPISQVRDAFLTGYKAQFGRDYPMWGLKQNGMAKNLLASADIARVLALIPYFLRWTNVLATRRGHTFEFFVSNFVELDSLVHSQGAHVARVANAQVATADLEKTTREEIEIAANAERFRIRDDAPRLPGIHSKPHDKDSGMR